MRLPADGPSDAKHRTRSVANDRVSKIPQATERAGLRTSSQHQDICTQSARFLGQHFLERANGDSDRSVQTGCALQLLDAAASLLLFSLTADAPQDPTGPAGRERLRESHEPA